MLFDLHDHTDSVGVTWRIGRVWEANHLLTRHHYLGPVRSGHAGSRSAPHVASWRCRANAVRRHPTPPRKALK